MVLQDDADDPDEDPDPEDQAKTLRKYFPLVLIYCFIMAFVVAAGVEEVTKHFAVRCCKMNSQTNGIARGASPQTVLVYLLTAALGFATAENMEYVFGVHVHGGAMNALVGELTVLSLRLLMPVHLICAVLQAANLSKVVLGMREMSLFQVLLPAVLLHGAFDFVLFLLGAVSAAFAPESMVLLVLSFLLPVLITIGGLIYAIRSYKEVEALYDSNWRPVRGDEEMGTGPLAVGLIAGEGENVVYNVISSPPGPPPEVAL